MILKKISAILYLCILFPPFLHAEEVFNHLSTTKGNAPYLLDLALLHLQTEKIDHETAKEILRNLKSLNDNLSGISKADQHFFIISELYKSILNYKFNVKTSTDSISSIQIKSLNTNLTKYKVVYSSFAQFIIQSTYLDFEDFIKDNYFDDFQALKGNKKQSYVKATKLRKVLKYSGQWVSIISTTPATQFNKIGTDLISNFLENTSKQSQTFRLHAPQLKEPQTLINGLDHIAVETYIKALPDKMATLPTEISPLQIKDQAAESVKALEVDPIEKAAEDLDSLFKNNSL